MSDFVHISEDYKAGVDEQQRSKVDAELVFLRAEKKKIDDHYARLKTKATELPNLYSAFLGQVGELEKVNEALEAKFKGVESQVEELKAKKDSGKMKLKTMEEDLSALRQSQSKLEEENTGLQLEVQKGVEDVAKALGDGYGRCLGRVSSSGFDVTSHSFEDYIRDYAATVQSGVQDKEAAVDP